MSITLQYLIIAALVLASAVFVWRTRFPRSWRRARGVMAMPMLREGRPQWLRNIGRAIAPEAVSSSNPCGGCNGCD